MPDEKNKRSYIKKILFHLVHYFNIKTLAFNFKYFSFSKAILLPIYVSSKTRLGCLKGCIEITENIKPGMITIGYGHVPIFDKKKSRCVWNVKGKVVFKGTGDIGHGSKICVYKNGCLSFGNNIQITAESSVLCEQEITFGNDCLLSWNILILDSDLHKIYDTNDEIINHPSAITIGNNVWIGCGSTLLKGTAIPDNCVIGSGSMVTKKFCNSKTIISGNPAVEKRKINNWSPESFSDF